MSAYWKNVDETKYTSFLLKDYELLETENEKKIFDCELVINTKYLAAGTKSCNRKINTVYHNNEIPKESS